VIHEDKITAIEELTRASALEHRAFEEIDRPLSPITPSRQADPTIKPAPMSEETEKKLGYSWRIVIACFITIGVLIAVDVLFALLGITGESGTRSTVMDLVRTVILLAVGFMFGNQNKS